MFTLEENHRIAKFTIQSVHFALINGSCACWLYIREIIGRKWEAQAETPGLAFALAMRVLIDTLIPDKADKNLPPDP